MIKTTHTVTLSKIEHRGFQRIKIEFERNTGLIAKVKSIPNRRWSKSKKCWHLPYSKESYLQLKSIFGDEELKILDRKVKINQREITPKINLPKEPNLIEYSLNGEIRKKYIGEKIIAQIVNSSWIKLYVPYHKIGWAEVIKNIQGRKWNPEKVYWKIPNVKESFRRLKSKIGLKNIQFDFKIEKDIPEFYKFDSFSKNAKTKTTVKGFDLLNELQKEAITKLEETLILKKLSYFTLKSYRSNLIGIFNFYPKIKPHELTVENIQKYILHLIQFKKISESTQNQIINSVKAYWERVLKRPKEKIEIPRPKKPKHLPNVFSQEEVIKLIESPNNLKHKLILLLIYSAGLRLSEVINIRSKDISLDRRVIFIKNGKGKKDRFVTLAEEVVPYLQEYKNQFRPNYWLIEGQHGGQYSKSSVQRIFHKALENSKIFAYGTVHTLRHSYATHCVENGFSIGLLQEALGHGSIKTTERYLHISSNALKKLTSPLDLFKGKGNNKV